MTKRTDVYDELQDRSAEIRRLQDRLYQAWDEATDLRVKLADERAAALSWQAVAERAQTRQRIEDKLGRQRVDEIRARLEAQYQRDQFPVMVAAADDIEWLLGHVQRLCRAAALPQDGDA